jgi:hypothetical protein
MLMILEWSYWENVPRALYTLHVLSRKTARSIDLKEAIQTVPIFLTGSEA